MKEVLDVALNRNESIGANDLAFEEKGDYVLDTTIGTAIRISLLTDKRASESEVSNINERGGWWGNEALENENFQIGSKLWLLNQSRLTQTELNLAIAYSKDSLSWLIDQNFVDNIQITGSLKRIERKIILNVILIKNGNILAEERIEYLALSTGNIN